MDLNLPLATKKVITVSGSHKGVGKTALSEILLSYLPHFTAIKITMTSREIGLYEDDDHLMVADTDTFRMKKSGAEQVLWIRTTEEKITDLMAEALERVGDKDCLLIEGNTILRYVNPTLACFVTTASIDTMKPSRITALEKADLCVLNQWENSKDSYELSEKIKKVNPSINLFSFNLINNTQRGCPEFERFMAFVQDSLN